VSAQIEDIVSTCTICARYQRNNLKELLLHNPPYRPWEKVGADLCALDGLTYLVLVDYCSNFIEVEHLKETTSIQVIKRCKSQFARHGIPDIVFSDNGPQFSSQQFRDFASAYRFEHQTSSPHYPQSNGKVEKAVQTVKNILKKARDDKQDPYLALLALRNTPIDDQIGSPAQQLMGRRTRTLLPTTKQLLAPKIIRTSAVRKSIVGRQERQKHYHDLSSTRLPPLSIGDSVMIKEETSYSHRKS
jgi:transposase InsO family protein